MSHVSLEFCTLEYFISVRGIDWLSPSRLSSRILRGGGGGGGVGQVKGHVGKDLGITKVT